MKPRRTLSWRTVLLDAKALALGGQDEGPPGLRREYADNYYAAFVRDLDGNKIEAVCHLAEAPATP
jgi:hypothetical protein